MGSIFTRELLLSNCFEPQTTRDTMRFGHVLQNLTWDSNSRPATSCGTRIFTQVAENMFMRRITK